MELVEIFGYASALLIGITLGLIGGGGSILAVPVLAYLFYVNTYYISYNYDFSKQDRVYF